MALEMRAAPQPGSARLPPQTAARAPWAMVAGRPLLAAYWTRRRAAKRPRSQLRSGRRWRIWYRIPESRQTPRRVPTEYGCYGGLRPAPVGPDGLEGTNEGTEAASTKRITAATRTADFVLRSLSLGPSEIHR
jgi:hypothetical protein